MKLKLFVCTFTAIAVSASIVHAGITGAHTDPNLKYAKPAMHNVALPEYKLERNSDAQGNDVNSVNNNVNVKNSNVSANKPVTKNDSVIVASADDGQIKCSRDENGLLFCLNEKDKPYTGRRVVYGAGGNPASIENFKNGYLDGLSTYFDESGQRHERSYYKMGIKNGTHKIYYSDNNIKVLTTYKDGILNGTLDVYLPDGSLKGRMRYKSGYLERGYCRNGKKKEDFGKEMLKSYPFNTIEACGVGL